MGSKIVGLDVVFDGTLRRERLQGSRTLRKTDAVGSGVDDRHYHTADAEEDGEVERDFHDEAAKTYEKNGEK
jgi:hypothetical protein